MKHCTLIPIKDQKAMHAGGVESSSIYYKGCNALYVEGVKRSSKWSYTSLLITFLIFN